MFAGFDVLGCEFRGLVDVICGFLPVGRCLDFLVGIRLTHCVFCVSYLCVNVPWFFSWLSLVLYMVCILRFEFSRDG